MLKVKKAVLIFIVILLSGVIAMGSELVTVQDVYDAASLTETDVAPERIKRLIEKHGIDQEMLQSIPPEEIHDVFLKAAYDYTYLFGIAGDVKYQSGKIHCIAVLISNETMCKCALFDFDSRKIYYDPVMHIFNDISGASFVVQLESDGWDVLFDPVLPEIVNLSDLETRIEGMSVVGGVYKQIVIENDTGIYSYSVSGITDSENHISNLIDQLLNFDVFAK